MPYKIIIKKKWKEFYSQNEDFICDDIKFSKDKEHIYPLNDGSMHRRLATNNCIIIDLNEKLSDENFDKILLHIVDETPADVLIKIPEVYGLLAEHFNNEVLDILEK